jgi:hypothetical protein
MTTTKQTSTKAAREAEWIREGTCPVAKLAIEAADILRLGKSLGIQTLFDPESEPDFKIDTDSHPIIRQMRAAKVAPDFSVESIGAGLLDALNRLLNAAKAFEPKSLKGALFHLYLAGYVTELGYVDELQRADRTRDSESVVEVELQITRLMHTAIAAIEAQLSDPRDPDLVELKRYLFRPTYQRHVLMQHVFDLYAA